VSKPLSLTSKMMIGAFLMLVAFAVAVERPDLFSWLHDDDTIDAWRTPSMSSCLAAIRRHSGKEIRDTPTDEPDHVSGFLTDGRYFSCAKHETGTSGTYFEGYFK
jgi:hypothetical protein